MLSLVISAIHPSKHLGLEDQCRIMTGKHNSGDAGLHKITTFSGECVPADGTLIRACMLMPLALVFKSYRNLESYLPTVYS